jgi:hypothetical protein
MMKHTIALLIGLALTLGLFIGQVQAQDNGSIRGTLYEDLNGDGRCGPGDPILAWVPIKFVSEDGRTTVFLQSGDNGTYGLVAAGYSNWQVSADPPAPWVVTSAKTRQFLITAENPLALNVDFCLTDTDKTPVRRTLPVSGAPISAPLAGAIFLGLSLMASGLGLEWRRRRQE